MLQSASPFRKTAFTLTRRTAFAVMTAAALTFSFPSFAQQVVANSNAVTSSPACAGIKDSEKSTLCEIEQSKLRTQAANAQAQALNANTACLNEVTEQIKAAKKAGPLSPEQKAAFKAKLDGCDKS